VIGLRTPAIDRQLSRRPLNVITSLHRTSVASIEELTCAAPVQSEGEPGLTDRFHIVLPLTGSFQYNEGNSVYYSGVNQVLLVPAGREYRISHPIEGDRSLVIFPRSGMAESKTMLATSRAGDTQMRVAFSGLRLAAFELISAARAGAEPLVLDELAIEFYQILVDADRIDAPSSHIGRGSTLAKAKELLHARFRESLSLADVAEAAGVTAVYLTQLFKRSTGMALHQYLMELRLNEALHALPDTSDLTALALDLGFSSHSHFTSVFRSRFKITPSQLRNRAFENRVMAPMVPINFPQWPLCVARGGDPAEQLN
jgi:AraC family transcriptional regulator